MLLAFVLRKQAVWIQHDEFKWIISCQLLAGNASSRSQQGFPLIAALSEHFEVGAEMKNRTWWSLQVGSMWGRWFTVSETGHRC